LLIDADVQHHPPLQQPAVIAHAAAEQVRVRHDDLFTADTAQACALYTDVFHRAAEVVDLQSVADHERPIERDRQRREQVAENVLSRERHRDTADAQTGQQWFDLDTEIVQRQQQDERPDGRACHEADHADRAGCCCVVRQCRASLAVQRAEHADRGPDADLPERGDREQRLQRATDRCRQHQPLSGDEHRRDQKKQHACAARHVQWQFEQLRFGRRRQLGVT
jgi:hypothetical protein